MGGNRPANRWRERDPLLEVANLEVVYHDVVLVLRGISFEVPDGKIVALLGANGAGKTTVLRAISGLLDVHHGDITKGEVRVDGDSVHKLAPAAIVERGVTQVMEGRRIFAEFTVEENLRVGAHTNPGQRDENLTRVFDLFPVLKDRRKRTAGYLSGGEQQMLAIGRALMTNPKLLILDEATEGLAPLVRQKIWAALREIRDTGLSILIVDKNLRDLMTLADMNYVIQRGQVVWSGTSAELYADASVRETYLGL